MRTPRPDLGKGDRIERVMPMLKASTGTVQAVKPLKGGWVVEWVNDDDGMTWITPVESVRKV